LQSASAIMSKSIISGNQAEEEIRKAIQSAGIDLLADTQAS